MVKHISADFWVIKRVYIVQVQEDCQDDVSKLALRLMSRNYTSSIDDWSLRGHWSSAIQFSLSESLPGARCVQFTPGHTLFMHSCQLRSYQPVLSFLH